MIVSTKGRYALRVMVDLAERGPDAKVPLKAIAEGQDLSEKYLEGIMAVLVRAEYLEGMRGKGGGYRLTRDPEDYSVAEILKLTETSYAAVSCLQGETNTCPRADTCKTLPMWKRLNDMIDDFFSQISVADLAEENCDFEI